jgi:hypothetical protein
MAEIDREWEIEEFSVFFFIGAHLVNDLYK